ncbi:beta-ketoacyl synthase N-terminal-like domain-containing protein [Streptomyces longispororuber]|nr:beta-ketoacyl synthase N-terminal-like domain-containing protein [Streptomyces longispororuber]
MAWTTPLGDDLDGVWRRLCAGESAIAPVPTSHRLRTTLAAVVPSVPYGDDPGDRQHALAERTLRAAFEHAGLAPDDPRVSVVVGTSYAAHLDTLRDEPLDAWAVRAARRVGHPHPPVCAVTACSAGSDTLVIADALIRAGRSRICVVGGVDVVTEAKRLAHSALGTMSRTGLRAFDTSHDGMVLGEGAAFLVVETAAGAAARGAAVHARLLGTASSNDAAGLTMPDPTGESVTTAVRNCLRPSRTAPRDIGVVCAHGTGTPLNDEAEAAVLTRLFDDADPGPTVFGTKGALGHSLGATGAIEAVATVQALRHRVTPPLPGLRSPLSGLRVPLSTGGTVGADGTAGISLTLGFGGFNTCLLFERGAA